MLLAVLYKKPMGHCVTGSAVYVTFEPLCYGQCCLSYQRANVLRALLYKLPISQCVTSSTVYVTIETLCNGQCCLGNL